MRLSQCSAELKGLGQAGFDVSGGENWWSKDPQSLRLNITSSTESPAGWLHSGRLPWHSTSRHGMACWHVTWSGDLEIPRYSRVKAVADLILEEIEESSCTSKGPCILRCGFVRPKPEIGMRQIACGGLFLGDVMVSGWKAGGIAPDIDTNPCHSKCTYWLWQMDCQIADHTLIDLSKTCRRCIRIIRINDQMYMYVYNMHPSIHSFTHLFIQSFIQSVVHLFTYLPTRGNGRRDMEGVTL